MKQTGIAILVAGLALAAIPVSGAMAESAGDVVPAAGPVIHIEDVARFYKIGSSGNRVGDFGGS
jgi:hypothetical protein